MSEPDQQNAEIIAAEDLTPDLFTQPSTGALQRMEAEARALQTAYKIASALSKTQMVPEIYQQTYTGTRNNPHPPLGEKAAWNLAAAILYGSELGLSALQSAQNVFIVKGKPAVYARTMAACVRRAGYVLEEVEASDEKVVWKGLRDGVWAFTEWDIKRAEKAEYTTNALYQKNPQEMLRAKCIAEVCRIKYQDVITGLAYSVEELQLQDVTVERVVPAKQGVRGTAKLREIAEAQEARVSDNAAEPESGQERARLADDAEAQAENNPPAERPSTNAQLTEIRKLYKVKGITGQGILDDLSQYLQRKVERLDVGSITHDEAADVIRNQTPPADS